MSGLSVSIVLTVSTFNLLVSQDLPKINYSTLLDWYVWKCFLFVIAAVAEFAVVNHLLVSKTYPPMVARLVDDFFQWTVPVVWCLSNLIYWPILPGTALNALFGVVMGGYIGLNAYRIWWCYKHEKEGMVAPIKALYGWTARHLDEADRLAKEQIDKNSRHLAKIGIHTAASRRTAAARRGRSSRGRGTRRGRGGARAGRDGLAVDAHEEEEAGEGMDLSVIVTPPTPHVAKRGAEGKDGHERALGGVNEEEEDVEELELSDIEQAGDTADQHLEDGEEEEEDVIEEAAGAVHMPSEKRRQGSLLYSTAAQEDDEEKDDGEDVEGTQAADTGVEVEQSQLSGERLIVTMDSSGQLRNDEFVEDDGGMHLT